MKKLLAALVALGLVAAPTAPAWAGWKLIEQGASVEVAKSDMRVTPSGVWNRWTKRPVKQSETWTRDGTNLNQLYFVSGLPDGKTLYKDTNKKARPLPKLSKSLDLTEIPEFYESSTRLVMGTSVFEMTSVEPAKMGEHDAVKFTFDYSIENSPLKRQGVVMGTMIKGELHLISFLAPATYFFERDLAEVEAIMASVSL
ncbi:MAG: hypothetical protein AAGH57_07090 [Pseudomonadota bacterium]